MARSVLASALSAWLARWPRPIKCMEGDCCHFPAGARAAFAWRRLAEFGGVVVIDADDDEYCGVVCRRPPCSQNLSRVSLV
ncbi:hypothetical protein QYE76_023112 [Lolium multiflorum]|uniref:Uncharacterized protein n=1 Tax=Lolium multiflorum TaxID=4521 RepID=A0AAD8R9V4_LOLMU|nr:hypothetical protein QYE76_023112 [Lolium multiflorum]